MVEYSYDPWGNILAVTGSLASTLGADNPFRYRSYYYDTESCFYYLNSRYYDAKVCRWISPEPNVNIGGFDSNAGFLGYNSYVYCANNPICCADYNGKSLIALILIGIGIGVAVGGTVGGVAAYNSAKESGEAGSDLFWSTAAGVGKGAVIGGTVCGFMGASMGIGATFGFGSTAFMVSVTTTTNVCIKTSEVAILQSRKSSLDGLSFWQTSNNTFDAMFTNLPYTAAFPFATTPISLGGGIFIENIKKQPLFFIGANEYLRKEKSSFSYYLSPFLSLYDAIFSASCPNPRQRAAERGYTLK